MGRIFAVFAIALGLYVAWILLGGDEEQSYEDGVHDGTVVTCRLVLGEFPNLEDELRRKKIC